MKDKLIALRLDIETWKRLQKAAKKDDRSVSWIIRKAVEQYLRK